MARRGGDGGTAANPINVIIGAFIGLLVIVAIVTLGPVLGYKLENSVGGDIPATSNWSSSDPNAVKGSSVWQDNVSLLSLCLLILFISMAIFYVRIIG